MEFGVLFTSHPNHVTEPYPHRAVHARVTAEIQAADRLGYDTAWVAEHHFSNQYGIMPDVFTYMGSLARRFLLDSTAIHAPTAPDRRDPPHSHSNHAQEPHPPLFMAGATDRSLGYAARHGFGLMLSTLPSAETLARQIGLYRSHLKDAPAPLDRNPGFGKVDIARWVYVADTDAAAKRDTEQGIVRHISHFMGAGTAGYLGNVSEKNRAEGLTYDELAATTLLHGSPATVIAKLRELRHKTGLTSLLLHYPPYYGHDNAMRSLRLFAEKVMPEFRPPVGKASVA
jgi:alkanesulfonate monooxygenase SsuD/methylene tetrahydromethanopterin reductase-like flavin-dependent oxidoreductase (luciferase family)